MDLVTQLRKLAEPRGLRIIDRGQGHIQLVGGPLLVNYYPLAKKRSAYIAGTTSRCTEAGGTMQTTGCWRADRAIKGAATQCRS